MPLGVKRSGLGSKRTRIKKKQHKYNKLESYPGGLSDDLKDGSVCKKYDSIGLISESARGLLE